MKILVEGHWVQLCKKLDGISTEPYNADRHVVGNLTLDKFIVDFDFDSRDVAFDTKERFEMLCVFDNPTPRFSANEVSDIRDP